jgi:hypothetical protein
MSIGMGSAFDGAVRTGVWTERRSPFQMAPFSTDIAITTTTAMPNTTAAR